MQPLQSRSIVHYKTFLTIIRGPISDQRNHTRPRKKADPVIESQKTRLN